MNKAVMILSAIFLISFAAGQVQLGNATINTQYAPNDTLSGFLNISINSVSSHSYVVSNTGQTMLLKDLLKLSTANYTCSTSDCNDTYTASDARYDENFTLANGSSQTFGLVVESNTGTINSVSQNTFRLYIEDDIPKLSSPALSIDLLSDGNPEWISYVPSGQFGQRYGCYSLSDFAGHVGPIDSTGLCAKISIPVAPNVNLHADISGAGGQLTMTIQKVGNSTQGTCVQIPSNGQVNCVPKIDGVDYAITSAGYYYICISDTSGSGGYQINRVHDTNPVNTNQCGFYKGNGFPPVNYTADYPIFVEAGEFAPVGKFLFNNTETGKSWYHLTNLESQMTGYLTSKYSNICLNGCVIPITFTSFADQNINLSSFRLTASTATGPSYFEKIYNVTKESATISTKGYQILSFNNAGFMVSGTPGNSTFTLTLYDGSTPHQILSKTLSIGQIPQVSNIFPRTTAATIPTNFTAVVNNYGTNTSVSQYQWNFGDGSAVQTTSAGIVAHTFSQIKAYNVQVTISTPSGLTSSANFTVDVVAPKDAVDQLLTKNIIGLANIQSQMTGYNGFIQNAVGYMLNLNSINTTIRNLIIKNSSASTDSDYLSMMNSLVQINLPDGIELSSSANSVPFIPSSDSINLDALQRVGGGTYDPAKRDSYKDAIIGWNLNNISMTIDYNEFSGIYGLQTNLIGGTYKLNILGNGKHLSKVYLFIPELEGIHFDNNYTKMGSYYYVPLNGSSQTVQFSTTQQLSLVKLPIFISPSLDQVSIPDTADKPVENKGWILILIFGGITLVGIICYIFIGRWYKNRYESYLFKDKNDLYNIINYIHSAKSRGIKEEEIEKNLRKSTWTSEQVNYIMKRYAGKSVGFLGFKKDNIKK